MALEPGQCGSRHGTTGGSGSIPESLGRISVPVTSQETLWCFPKRPRGTLFADTLCVSCLVVGPTRENLLRFPVPILVPLHPPPWASTPTGVPSSLSTPSCPGTVRRLSPTEFPDSRGSGGSYCHCDSSLRGSHPYHPPPTGPFSCTRRQPVGPEPGWR